VNHTRDKKQSGRGKPGLRSGLPGFVPGRRVLETVLKHAPDRLKEIYLLEGLTQYDVELERVKNLSLRRVRREELDELSGGEIHQGVLFRLSELKTESLEQLLKQENSLLLVLDGIVDPQNLGSLLRVAEVSGVSGVIVTERKSAPLNATVRKASAGASELIPVVSVTNLSQTLDKLKRADYWTVGAALSENSISLFDFEFPKRTAIILGSEGEGIRRLTEEKSDFVVKLPMFGKIESLNVAQAGAVFLFEYQRQQLKCGGK